MRTTHAVLLASAVALASCGSGDGSSPSTPGVTVSAIAVGSYHACAVSTSGAVWCWGSNSEGELGNPAHLGGASFTPVLAASVASPAGLVAGGGHTCALLASGRVECWGRNDYGQLGDGDFLSTTASVPVSGLTAAEDVAAGVVHGCAVAAGGAVRCWGINNSGQLGDPTVATTAPANRSAVPVTVAGVAGATAVAAGTDHSCALLGDATVTCWGGRFNGYPTSGSPYHDPVAVTSLADVIALAAGANHNCAVVAGGAVKCWALNRYGQLGNGTSGAGADSPTEAVFVSGITSATAVTAGYDHSCALLAGGTVACWGRNDRGQLGDGTYTDRAAPVNVTGVAGATRLGAGAKHTCALVSGEVKCWGDNLDGQLGLDPAVVYTSVVPVTIGF